jgi:ferredoxin
MTDLGDRYFVEALTPAGEAVVARAGDLFRSSEAKDRDEVQRVHAESEAAVQRQIPDLEGVPAKLKRMFESPFWDDESRSCIRCGICTYLCPTCHCFDINDEVARSQPLEGARVRTWDTCQFPDFTMHSSGHNPRGDKASRLRQRIMHKFQYFVERYQDYQCTGCGRCITECPVGIDIVDVLAKVSENGQ